LKKPLIIILVILLIDQSLKVWIKTHMFIGQEIHVIGDWFILHFTENNGMAFGMELAGESGALGNLIDSAFYGLIFSESAYYHPAQLFPEGGGYSTFLHGKVVDMFYFPVVKGHYPSWFPFWGSQEFIFFRPVFNIADSAITVGVFTLIVFQRKLFPKKPDPRPFEPEGEINIGAD